MKFNTVEEALDELRAGKIILVTDDEDRENEGDFICAAEFATTENIAIKLMFSVLANSAAQMKSPSFSRSGSSVTRMIFPCFRSCKASGMVLKFIVNSP